MAIGINKNYTQEMKDDIDFNTEILADDIEDQIADVLNYLENDVELWFGASADQSGDDWALEQSLTPYRAISGDGDYGSDANDEAKIFGLDDFPIIEGESEFNMIRMNVYNASQTTPYILRLIWGTTTLENALSLGNYSLLELSFDNFAGVPFNVSFPKIGIGEKVWIQAKNATDNATIDFFIGIRGKKA